MARSHKTCFSRVAMAVCLLHCAAPSYAQDADIPAAPQPQPQPVATMNYEVSELVGVVRVSPIGLDPMKEEGWRRVKRGELLSAGSQISTGIRSRIRLAARPAEPPTVVMLESMTLLSIDELALLKQDGQPTHRVRFGLAYGAVRAGVAETEVRSDMEIHAPGATLSKRGTDIFRFEYNLDGRFSMSLSEQGRGMLQAIQYKFGASGAVLDSRSRLMTPGQGVTHRMLQAITSVKFDRAVNINDQFGLGESDLNFVLNNDRGFGFLLPVEGQLYIVDTPTGGIPQADGDDMLSFPQGPAIRDIREGDFGIGQGLLPGIFGGIFQQNPTQQSGVQNTVIQRDPHQAAPRGIQSPRDQKQLQIRKYHRPKR